MRRVDGFSPNHPGCCSTLFKEIMSQTQPTFSTAFMFVYVYLSANTADWQLTWVFWMSEFLTRMWMHHQIDRSVCETLTDTQWGRSLWQTAYCHFHTWTQWMVTYGWVWLGGKHWRQESILDIMNTPLLAQGFYYHQFCFSYMLKG